MRYGEMSPGNSALAPGPYYGAHEDAAAAGFGADGDASSFAVQQLIGILRGTQPGAVAPVTPFGIFTPWGKQVGGVSWETIETPDYDLMIYPLAQRHLKGAAKSSFGHPVPWVGLLSRRPIDRITLERALESTPYDLEDVQGIYMQADGGTVPRIVFLYWLVRHDDFDRGGGASIEKLAKSLGARLVFPQQIARRSRSRYHPQIPFEVALQGQLAPPAVPASEPSTDGLGKIVAVSGLGTADAAVPRGLVATGLVALGAFAAWRWLK